MELVELLKQVGGRHGKSSGEVAIAWTLRHPAISGAIVGGRSAKQVEGVVGTAGAIGSATGQIAKLLVTMLAMALELASNDPAYEDVASKFFEHFMSIADAMNKVGETGLWDESDGFYYDWLEVDGKSIPLKVRSLVGLVLLIAVEVLDFQVIERLPGFKKRMQWFLENREEIAQHISCMKQAQVTHHLLLAIISPCPVKISARIHGL